MTQDQLIGHLGLPTATAMIAAGTRALPKLLAAAGDDGDGLYPSDVVAGILFASLQGLDGTELLGDLHDDDTVTGIADRVALHIGAELGRRIETARKEGYIEGVAAGAYAPGLWLIWSVKHRLWWRPQCAGYTTAITQAGRYTGVVARHETHRWDWDNNQPSSVMVPAPSLQLLAAPEVDEMMGLRVAEAVAEAVERHQDDEKAAAEKAAEMVPAGQDSQP